jgi:hypothetical protein
MKPELEPECPCTKLDCVRHGDCVACFGNHAGKPNPPACKRPGTVVPPGLAGRVEARVKAAGV